MSKTTTLTFGLSDAWEEWNFDIPDDWDRDDILAAYNEGTLWDYALGIEESGNNSINLEAIDGDVVTF